MNKFSKIIALSVMFGATSVAGAFAQECIYSPEMESMTDQEPVEGAIFPQTTAEVESIRLTTGCIDYAKGFNVQDVIPEVPSLYIYPTVNSSWVEWEQYLDQTHPTFWSMRDAANGGTRDQIAAGAAMYYIQDFFGKNTGSTENVHILGVEDSYDYARILIDNYEIIADIDGMNVQWVEGKLANCNSNFSYVTCSAYFSGDLVYEFGNGRTVWSNALDMQTLKNYAFRVISSR